MVYLLRTSTVSDIEISLSVALKRKFDNSDNTNICYNSKKAKRAKNVRDEEENSLTGGQMIFSEKSPRSSYVEQSPEKKKKKSKRTAQDNKGSYHENLDKILIFENQMRKKKKKRSKDMEREEVLKGSYLENLDKILIFENQMRKKKKKRSKDMEREEVLTVRDVENELNSDLGVDVVKNLEKKKKSRRTVLEDDETCGNTHTMPSDQVDEIPIANDEVRSPKKKKKKKKSKRTAQEDQENRKNILMMPRDQAYEKMKKEKKKENIDDEEDRSLNVSGVRESRPSCQLLEDVMGGKDKKSGCKSGVAVVDSVSGKIVSELNEDLYNTSYLVHCSKSQQSVVVGNSKGPGGLIVFKLEEK